MKNGRRKDIQDIVISKGGIPVERVTKTLDYLVIGALSNPCWAYSTYGRKIDSAMSMNRNGASIAIVHEDDVMRMLGKILLKTCPRKISNPTQQKNI